MWKKYKDKNAKQMTNFRLFLKKYKSKIRIDDQMRIYNRQFKNISIKLIQWKQLNIYTQCSWYLQNLFNFYRIKFVRKHNFNFLNVEIMTFEIVYKIVIVMTNINNVLRKLNVLNFKKSQNNIKKLMNMIENDYIAAKSFIAKNVFVLLILSIIIVFVTSNKTIKFLTKIFKIMQLNNVKVVITNDVQRIINFNLYQFTATVFFTTTMIINDAKNFL